MNYYYPFLYQPFIQSHEMTHANYRPTVSDFQRIFFPNDEVFVRVSDSIPEVVDYFWVSNYGNLYNEKLNCLVNQHPDIGNYLVANVRLKEPDSNNSAHSKPRLMPVHVMVCSAFHGPKPGPGYQVNHIDYNRQHNHESNLEWMTQQENLQYSRDGGRYHREDGSFKRSTHTVEEVRAICELLQAGVTQVKDIARIVYNSEVTPAISGLVRIIKARSHWTQISKDYTFETTKPMNKADPNLVHAICQFFQDHPNVVNDYSIPANEIATNYLGIDYFSLSEYDRTKFNAALHGVRYRSAYNKITSQYNYPLLDKNSSESR